MRRLTAVFAGLAAAAVLAACGPPAQGAPYPIHVLAKPVAADKVGTPVGALTYAGGLSLKAEGTDSFGGLSGMEVDPDGALIAVSDAGDLLRARVVLDPAGRLAGVEDATLARLIDENGVAFQNKIDADAEGLSRTDGGFAISFEQDHRVLVYADAGGAPKRLPAPYVHLAPNAGVEALAYWRDPASGAPRLVMGAERGDAWSCDLEGGDCRQILVAKRDNPGSGFKLTELDALPDGRLVALYRSAGLLTGLRAAICVVTPGADRPVVELARLPGPITADNMEAISAVPRADGSIRLYVMSDDNFAGWQRTLLLAFDWRPGQPSLPGPDDRPAGAP